MYLLIYLLVLLKLLMLILISVFVLVYTIIVELVSRISITTSMSSRFKLIVNIRISFGMTTNIHEYRSSSQCQHLGLTSILICSMDA